MENDAKKVSEKLYGFSAKTNGPNIGVPPEKPPIGFYPRKPAFWQIRGTRANTISYSWCAGLTVASALLGSAIYYFKIDRYTSLLEYWSGTPLTREQMERHMTETNIRGEMFLDDIKQLIPDIDDTSKTVRQKYFELNREKGIRTDGPPKVGYSIGE